MQLTDIMEMWKKDAVIHPMNLDDASRETPILHAKYLELLTTAKLKLKQENLKQKVLLKDKWLYFSGKMDKKAMDERGWKYDPFDGLKIMKSDMKYYFESDADLQKSEEKIEYWKTLVDTLTEIVDTLKWRHQTIKNAIAWNQFTAGG